MPVKIDLNQSEKALKAARPEREAMLEATKEPFDKAWWALRAMRAGIAALQDGVTEGEEAISAGLIERAAEVMEGLAACRVAWQGEVPPPAPLPRRIALPGTPPKKDRDGRIDPAEQAAFDASIAAFLVPLEPFVAAADAVLHEYVEVRGLFEVDLARIDAELALPKAERAFAQGAS